MDTCVCIGPRHSLNLDSGLQALDSLGSATQNATGRHLFELVTIKIQGNGVCGGIQTETWSGGRHGYGALDGY